MIQTDLNCEIHSIHIWIALMSQIQTNPTKKKHTQNFLIKFNKNRKLKLIEKINYGLELCFRIYTKLYSKSGLYEIFSTNHENMEFQTYMQR